MKNIIFDFDAIGEKTDKASKKAAQLFARAGLSIASINVDAKTKRTAAISYRDISFTFADSQSVTFSIKSTGDIYQVKLNGKAAPITEQNDAAKAVQEIAAKLDANRTKFQKQLAALKIAVPEGMKSTKTKTIDLLIEQGKSLDVAIQEAQARLNELKSSLGTPIDSLSNPLGGVVDAKPEAIADGKTAAQA